MKFEAGVTFRLRDENWTIDRVSSAGMVFANRADGETARFDIDDLSRWAVERVPTRGKRKERACCK